LIAIIATFSSFSSVFANCIDLSASASEAIALYKSRIITGIALALHCRKAYARINRNIENSTPCKTITAGNLGSKLCTHHHVGDRKIGLMGASPQVGELGGLLDFPAEHPRACHAMSVIVLFYFLMGCSNSF